jgi:RNA-directed DNA polymerase
MMNERGKSDPAVVAVKRVNKAERSAAEPVEPRAGTKGNANQQHMGRTQGRETVPQVLTRIRQTARQRKKERFTALFHHINVELLRDAFFAIRREAAPGVDGVTWQDYAANVETNLQDLHARVQRGAYRALPSRRQYIPKSDGRQRPLAVAALEDKIVQRATAALLNAIYEEDFLGFSYGFRPGRSAHHAMDALVVGIGSRKVNWILDADIRSFFDSISQEWLVRFLEHRIGDQRIIRLIQKWLKAGVLEDGAVTVSEVGTGQGSVISPLLANIYLFYVLDLYAERWRRREASGDVIIVRYADDFIIGFEHETDAKRFLDLLRERMGKFALALHPEKTRLIEFGRHAAASRRQEIKQELRRRMHQPIREQGKWLKQVVGGYFRYHAVPTNSHALMQFWNGVVERWRRQLSRRSQKGYRTWTWIDMLADYWLPRPRILHPWPEQRFAVNTRGRSRMCTVAPVVMWRSAPKVAAQAG